MAEVPLMPAVRRRLVQGLAVLGALTVLAAAGWGVYLGVDQVRRYIAAQDARIASLQSQLDTQRHMVELHQGQLRTQSSTLLGTRRDVETLRGGLGALQLRTANQHSFTQVDITALRDGLSDLRMRTTGNHTDTVMDIANLRNYVAVVDRDIGRVEADAIDADGVHDQRLDAAEFAIRGVDTRVERIEGYQSEVTSDLAGLGLDLASLETAMDQVPSQRIAAGLLPAWLLMLSTEWGGHLGEYGEAETVRVRWSSSLDDDVFGDYNPQLHLIRIDEDLRGERPELLAAMLAHEFWHAVSTIPYPRTYAKCIEDEMRATLYEASVWNAFNLTPQTDAERGQQRVLESARRFRPADDTLPIAQWTAFRAYVEDTRGYRGRCSR